MESNTPRRHRLFYGSSYDRGLQYLLFMWPDIKQTYPDAELHITYGWNTFMQVATGNPERMEWKKQMEQLMKQDGIYEYGRVGKEQLSEIRKKCGIWAYPADFKEINCITALECQSDGIVPVTMALAALKETAKEGILIDGDITDIEVQSKYSKELISLMGDEKRWKKMSLECEKFSKTYYWSTIADKWSKYLREPVVNPKVSVLTPTIREGWWRIMSENLSEQTYKNFEWLIIDDYPEDRAEISKKYAKEYGLNIRYIRGEKNTPSYPRRCGLVKANNIGWQKSEGELIVWLQDFILIPENGVEQLVDLYRHNPDALIAPTDIYYDTNAPNLDNKEDWWEGKDVLTKETWRNPRTIGAGIRESENPFDWEANYGAIPKKILEELNGFWEFMDDGLGYDNTEIAYRAFKLGYRLLVDDSNIAKCINLWPHIGGTEQNVSSRERILNMPRWKWLVGETESGKLPVKRDINKDRSISLPFTVPKLIEDKDCAKWIEENSDNIIRGW